MRRLGCAVVGVLLLLGAALLSPVAVATARGETLMATSRDEWRGRAGAVDGLGTAPEEPAPPPPAATASEDGEDVIWRRKEEVAARISHQRFRSRRIPASQVQFGGRIPFTADYHSVHRHPPTHN
ncbi:hypothetical protein HU200_040482 [Digitaria exilis]|uniref:Uncharacterized protein n=1 Tax=Digitaria exilis TaxID=1010633 RepID=A0A835BEI1_9POAL|nr:hypothetical protein HU200_040482 [Digitaria exilis]CAB3445915.1 unnamed protein product [Digitaria exilis]CAB3449160.1 unnamed protein product [Digitaria exilis]